MIEIPAIFNDLLFKGLTDENLPVTFNCGDKDLEDFLLEDAGWHAELDIAHTTLIFYQNKVAGYFSLLMDAIRLNPSERSDVFGTEPELRYREYPALKIGRLAIAEDCQRKGIGTCAFLYILGLAQSLQTQREIGVKFISVDAYNNEDSLRFYKRCKFEVGIAENPPRKDGRTPGTISMYYDIRPYE
ncbi:MAG: GNAT family N-acetyltransferase [Actinobacteria bacterium]|nr:GNAT family N-acetyltransferase [Actinomycetota bacterium]